MRSNCSGLLDQGVEQVVIACNTATAVAIEMIRAKYNVQFVGVEPDLNFLKRNNMTDGGESGGSNDAGNPENGEVPKIKGQARSGRII